MSEFCIAAIDPGTSGAVAFYFPSHPKLIAAEDVPVAADQIDAATLADRLGQMKPDIMVIERVGSMPGQGLSSTFKFGRAYGTIIGVVAALRIPTKFVTPAKWKRALNLPADKEECRARALQTWPEQAHLFARKKDHGRAEAALLAVYGQQAFFFSNPGAGEASPGSQPLTLARM